MKTNIEWTDVTWNPIAGCSPVSPGCTNCYAAKMARRLEAMGQVKYAGTAERRGKVDVFTGKINFDDAALAIPLRWRKPNRIFVNSMSDLFHEAVPDEFIDKVFAVMALCPQHTFQVLTKRPKRMLQYMLERWQPLPAQSIQIGDETIEVPAQTEGDDRRCRVDAACEEFIARFNLDDTAKDRLWTADGSLKAKQYHWPLRNAWLGVSVEDQQRADERIPLLLQTPAAVRFLSVEPMLGPVDLSAYFGGEYATPMGSEPNYNFGISWIICGGESGPGARPMHVAWARSLRDQCQAAGVPFFMKQMDKKQPIPDDLFIREFPLEPATP